MIWCCQYCSHNNLDKANTCSVCGKAKLDDLDFLVNPYEKENDMKSNRVLWPEHQDKYILNMDNIKKRGFLYIERWDKQGQHYYRVFNNNGDNKILDLNTMLLLVYLERKR